MSILDKFTGKSDTSVEAFQVEESLSQGTNKATTNQKAAYAAVLNEGTQSPTEVYNQVQSDMSIDGTSQLADTITQEEKDFALLADQRALGELIADPEISLEQKRITASEFIDAANSRYQPRDLLSTKAVVEDSVGENAEQETVRVNTSAIIREVNQSKKQRQALLNSELAKESPDTMDTVVDFMELMVPFTESTILSNTLGDYKRDGTLSEKAATFGDIVFLTGSDKMVMVKALKAMPVDERMAATQLLVDAINSNSDLLLPDDNDLARMDMLNTFLEDGYYTTEDEWIDNAISILDLTMLGGVVRPFAQTARLGRTAVRTKVSPTSVSQNLKDTNPSKARLLHNAVTEDVSDEVAEGAYGTNRTEAIAADLGPEVGAKTVENKVGNIGSDFDGQITPDADIMDLADTDGAIYFWEDEKRQARTVAYEDFRNPLGLTLRSEMSQIGEIEDKVRLGGVYGPLDGGFASAEEAVAQTSMSLRKYGISDKHIKLMVQKGDVYEEVPDDIAAAWISGGAKPQGGFLTKVEYDYAVSPLNVTDWAEANVKWNIFDRIPATGVTGQGSFQRHLLDAHSMLHPNITFGASVAVDKSAGLERNLLELSKAFTDRYSSLPRDKQFVIEDYIREANDKGIAFDKTRLMSDGYSQEMLDTVSSWRNYWDTMYWLENRDLAKTLNNRGFRSLETGDGANKIFARPLAQASVSDGIKVYNPASNKVEFLSASESAELYSKGGTVAKTRQPLHIDGDVAEFIRSEENSASYLRGINSDDQVLNYRKGYYSVNYTAPKFVVERVKDKTGKVLYERAVAVAGDTKDAQLQAKRLATTKGKKFDQEDATADFFVRDNVKSMRMDSDDYWSLQTLSGRSAQRIRGERLNDASGSNLGAAASFQMGPVDSMIHAARNIARRVPMRDYLESTKLRFTAQYADVIPRDKFGEPMFPRSRKEIGREGRAFDKQAADARTTFEYIDSLEGGYINGMDEAYKASLKLISNILGKGSLKTKGTTSKALSKVERGAEAVSEARGPVGMAKNVAFQAYLASNPLRQLVIQSHQTVLLTAVNPEYMVKHASRDIGAVLGAIVLRGTGADAIRGGAKLSGRSVDEFKEIFEAWERSGAGAAVDKQNLVRGSLSDMADSSRYGGSTTVLEKAAKPLTVALHVSRRLGFDSGEYINSLTSFLAYYDLVKKGKRGVKMTQADADLAAAKGRNVALNMNQAGEMPYNQNSLAVFFQFLQVPHKMATSIVFNRGLTKGEKFRVGAANFLLFGVGGKTVYEVFDQVLPENPEVKEAAAYGLEQFLVNRMLSLTTGEETRISFEGLAPTDMYGINEFLTSLWTEDLGTILASSPSGQLFFGNNPRITNAFKTAASYFNLRPDSGDLVEASTVFESFARISSGYSNAGKANLAWTYGLKRNSQGGVVDENVSSAEAIAQAFGFTTMDESRTYLTGDILYENSKAFEEDFKLWFNETRRLLVQEGLSPEDRDFQLKIMNAGLNMFEGNKARFQKLLFKNLKFGVEVGKDARLYKGVVRAAGIMDDQELKGYIEALPWEDEAKKQSALDVFNFEMRDE